jgi:hypothetical protein
MTDILNDPLTSNQDVHADNVGRYRDRANEIELLLGCWEVG